MWRGESRGERVAWGIGLAGLVVLIIAAYLVLRPFLAALLWALILALATWPGNRRLRSLLSGRNTLAAALMTLVVATVLVGPLLAVGGGVADNMVSFVAQFGAILERGLPPPPTWLMQIPMIGPDAAEYWRSLASSHDEIADLVRTYIGPVTTWLLHQAGSLGGALLDLSMSIVFAFFFYRDGDKAARYLHKVIVRVIGPQAHRLIDAADTTLCGVVYGVIGAAIVQGVLAGIGYWIAGMPSPFFLAVATGFVGLIPNGTFLVWLPVTIVAFVQGPLSWGIFLLSWNMLLVGNADAVIRSYFIAKGSPLPLLLVFLGVLGGAVAFGFLGLFLGPTILTVLYMLLREWTPADREPPASAPPPDATAPNQLP